MIFVCNSSVVIGLARIGKLDILKEVTGEVYISEAVYKEVAIDGKGMPGSDEVIKSEWIKKARVKDNLAVQLLSKDLGSGESESIILAQEMKADEK